MKRILLFSLLLTIAATNANAQLEESFLPAPSGWILDQGAQFTTVNGNGVVVTPSGGGNNHAVIGTPAVNKVSNTVKVCLDITPYTSNLNSQVPFPCDTYMDVLFVKSSVTTSNQAEVASNIYARVDNYLLPTNGGSSCFSFSFPAGVSATDFKVVLSFHAACTQSGIKLMVDNVKISGVDDVCASSACAPTALDDAFNRNSTTELSFNAVLYGSNLNYPAPGVDVAMDATGTDNDQNDTYAHLKWTLITPPANGTVTINPDGTCTIARNNLAVSKVTFTYRLCDDGADDNFATTGDDTCDDATVTVNFATNIVTPVLLKDFNVTRNGPSVILTWTTETESNNKGFEIQRSVGGSAYQAVGYLASKAAGGNSSMALQYTFTDRNETSQATAYRLVQEDKDGEKTIYGTRAVKGMDGSGSGMRLSANPVTTGSFSVYFDNSHTHLIMISDLNGRLIKQWPAHTQNSLTVNDLHAGIYMILVTDKNTGERITQKLVVTQ